MTTSELYHRLTASTLARIYFDIETSSDAAGRDEASRVYEAGVINCGESDFIALVAEYEAEVTK